MQLTFLGATDGVTGSRFLVAGDRGRILVDCGLFQGLKAHRLRNWERFPVDPASLDAVVLTHAHLDHSGFVPALAVAGFRGCVYASDATRALCAILLPDAGHLMEEEARYRNRTGTTRHHPARPPFTAEDARRALARFEPVAWDTPFEPAPGLHVRLSPVGHLLGAACVRVDDGATSILFSGDVGRPDDRLMPPPAPPPDADHLVVESTYGNRLHPHVDVEAQLADVVGRTVARGGTVLIPAFAVGRVQLVVHLLAVLHDAGRIPAVPVWIDSPMATEATRLFLSRVGEHRLSEQACARMAELVQLSHTPEQSAALDRDPRPKIVVSSSGMAAGGRVVHHLKALVGDGRNTVLLTGFQAAGTRGEALLHGADRVKIHGVQWPVRAEIAYLNGVSGHADRDELVAWLSTMRPPRRTWVVHGEPVAQDTMRREIADQLGWDVAIPGYRETVALPAR